MLQVDGMSLTTRKSKVEVVAFILSQEMSMFPELPQLPKKDKIQQ